MSFEAQPPADILLSLSLPNKDGDNSQWIQISLSYKSPNVIVVTKDDGS